MQQSDKDQGAYAAPGDQQKPVDEAQAVGLKPESGCHKIDRAGSGGDHAGRFGVEPCCHDANVLIRDPVATADVKPQQVRVQLFAFSKEVPETSTGIAVACAICPDVG